MLAPTTSHARVLNAVDAARYDVAATCRQITLLGPADTERKSQPRMAGSVYEARRRYS